MEPRVQIDIGFTESQAVAPPAISGGTLLALPDQRTVVAADSDRDQIYIVDSLARELTYTVPLTAGDEPGRLVGDSSGLVHVVLRRAGALVSVDPRAGVVTQRRSVCPAPRGLAHDAATGLLHVACAGGELVSLPADGGDPVRTLQLDRDLRDVVVDGAVLRVSRFRSAEILTVSKEGKVMAATHLGDFRSSVTRGGQLFTPAVAWRMVGMPDGGVGMVHQRGVHDRVQHRTSVPGSYGGSHDPCQNIVHSAVTRMKGDGSLSRGPALPGFPLAVDIAVSGDGKTVAVISAGNAHLRNHNFSRQSTVHVSSTESIFDEKRGCKNEVPRSPCGNGTLPIRELYSCDQVVPTFEGEAISVAFTADGAVMVQTREPAALNLPQGVSIQLSPDSRNDTGHRLFHGNAGAGLACASCHPEGEDDGRTWNFACAGSRRTQSLQIGLRGTEPFHWEGDERDFGALVRDVLTNRMAGPQLEPEQADSMLSWIDRQPRTRVMAPPRDLGAVARGRALYHDGDRAACATCHGGSQLTNNQTMDVGTGRPFQVPSLIGIANHAPYMHDGCANTLRDRFSPACGGGDKHGKTSDLSAAELSDLLTYLETL